MIRVPIFFLIFRGWYMQKHAFYGCIDLISIFLVIFVLKSSLSSMLSPSLAVNQQLQILCDHIDLTDKFLNTPD